LIQKETNQVQDALKTAQVIFAIWGIWLNKVSFKVNDDIINETSFRNSSVNLSMSLSTAHLSGNKSVKEFDGIQTLENWVSFLPSSRDAHVRNIKKRLENDFQNENDINGLNWFSNQAFVSSNSFGPLLKDREGKTKAEVLASAWFHVSDLFLMLEQFKDAQEVVKEGLSLTELTEKGYCQVNHKDIL
jgi:hypothetical protein